MHEKDPCGVWGSKMANKTKYKTAGRRGVKMPVSIPTLLDMDITAEHEQEGRKDGSRRTAKVGRGQNRKELNMLGQGYA